MRKLFLFLCFSAAKSSKKPLDALLRLSEKLFSFLCFSVAKSSKSHPTDSDVGVRKAESGVGRLFAGLQANRPRRCRFQPSARFSAIGTKSGIAMREKRRRSASLFVLCCRRWRHHQSALSFDAEKEGASGGASATGWRIGLILHAPCSAADRAIPRKTTCGGFWYFWPQKYKGKVHETCRFSKIHTSEQKSNSRGRKRAVARAGSGTKKADDFFKTSAVVAGGGLEPPTSGL